MGLADLWMYHKSLILIKLVYLWGLLLPNPPDQDSEELQKLSYKFIWNGKPGHMNWEKTSENGQ